MSLFIVNFLSSEISIKPNESFAVISEALTPEMKNIPETDSLAKFAL